MIIVTGAAGFIGSSLIKFLNDKGHADILAVEKMHENLPYKNLNGLNFRDLSDWSDFQKILSMIKESSERITIFHNGANSSTDITFKQAYIENYQVTRFLADYCVAKSIKLIYASSAGVYGRKRDQREELECEDPLTPYAFSKWLTDNTLRQIAYFDKPGGPVALRYFNVYGNKREAHKAGQMSPMMSYYLNGEGKQFFGHDSVGIPYASHLRDFVHVEDVCKVNYWFYQNPNKTGVYNVGSGNSFTFRDVYNHCEWTKDPNKLGVTKESPAPVGNFSKVCQNYTCANLENLRKIGYSEEMIQLKQGIDKMYKELSCEQL